MNTSLHEGKVYRSFWVFITILIFVSGCVPATQPTLLPIISNSATPSLIPTNTIITIPTATPTASITSLPTIPTFTPTFDASTIVTVTPAPKAECPNQSPSEVSFALAKELNSFESPKVIDITNDGFQEIILTGKSPDGIDIGSIFIYGCQNGSFSILLKVPGLFHPLPNISTIQDLNQNSIPEVVVTFRGCGGFGSCWVILVLEWDGREFQNLEDEQMNLIRAPWLDSINFIDMDSNGTVEIIINRGLPTHPDSGSNGPWRKYTETFSWNGKSYTLKTSAITPPQFTFQAIQEADQKSVEQNYDKALFFYQEAIFNKTLEWWSADRHKYYRNNYWVIDTPEPTPFPDPTEYPRLAAYAYYRIVLLHLVQGNESDATTTYSTLQQVFGNDPYGRPYMEMATAFWEAYQSTHKMYDGCAAAIQYAVEHPEILIPLGSNYHGAQSHIYVPADVCPFR